MTIEASNLSFRYGDRPVLREVSFALTSGRFHALLGPNGAGKSTLFGLLTRLLALQQGELRLAGQSLTHQPAEAMRQIGVVFQQNALDLDLTVRQNLQYHAALHGLSRKEARARGDRELERFNLLERANDAVRQLNGGHRRRVEIARALLHEPSLLLLDEPTVGLDVASRKALNEHVRTLSEEGGLTVLWATHLIEEVRADDRVLILHQGQLLADGNGQAICDAEGTRDLAETFHALTGAG
ncbi:ABC transporter ATP-binding protein [Marinobacter nauticus]|uniref:ABC transporter ATP-binding protein n=1 Tax=Marinobacter nauticus TaxID=2743 RepID=UPI001C93C8A2|nr:ABC transporter ATP-binding protein [Marinobacter nauticus]MBY5936714.1 ATP-binding cassette domain-containing protein [Marinobacter nauticus]MBY5953942.1 ATP-binding cassette domain-containing protein [Marinobacter nauticus]MBY5960631.1 ATP-binding cassette domain-containing protein [Marinobacter nauticus]MBY6007735.1 ATP-binding cassette domain-containing protein [Marinobacter nauticus]MBY6104017.1 ATP-binding cassette domain-containing protein [Marinobacter nauticus]